MKLCSGDSFVDGCNAFPAGKVSPLFIDTSLDGKLLPELSLASIQEGRATPGVQIQMLPPVKSADSLPGINCSDCKAPFNAMEPDLVQPRPVPK